MNVSKLARQLRVTTKELLERLPELGFDVGQRTIKIGADIIVKNLADAMGLSLQKVMAEMMKNGIMASLNERIDHDTAAIIAEDLGFIVETEAPSGEIEEQSQRERLHGLLARRHNTF